ncbi:MAG: DUF4038 domain-containing protein [Fimbriimonas sp.]|nr:DUF4038 domain-containing protein [Fimbriimonas sp.]
MPIRVAENSRHFVDAYGMPWFWLGDTAWHLFRGFSEADAQAIMENRRAKGFSVLLVMLIGYEGDPAPNIRGDLPWLDEDPGRPNERYYEHVDAILRIATELDFLVVLGIYHKSQHAHYTLESAHTSARWIADRYRNVPNIVWSMYPEARYPYIPIVRALASGLREGDGGSHMISVHPDPNPQSSSFLSEEPWLSFNMLQTCIDIELVHPMTAADYAMTPIRPAVMAEGGYEGLQFDRLNTPLDIRRQAYWTFLAGGHHVFGHNSHYQILNDWQDWIDSPGSFQVGTYRKIAESLPSWWDIVPDQSILHRGVGSGLDLAAAARSRAGDWALVYFPSPRTASVRLDRIWSSDSVDATWINPLTSDRSPVGTFPYSRPVEFKPPPDWEDALLLLNGSGSDSGKAA